MSSSPTTHHYISKRNDPTERPIINGEVLAEDTMPIEPTMGTKIHDAMGGIGDKISHAFSNIKDKMTGSHSNEHRTETKNE